MPAKQCLGQLITKKYSAFQVKAAIASITKQMSKIHGNGDAHQLKLIDAAVLALNRQRSFVCSVCL